MKIKSISNLHFTKFPGKMVLSKCNICQAFPGKNRLCANIYLGGDTQHDIIEASPIYFGPFFAAEALPWFVSWVAPRWPAGW